MNPSDVLCNSEELQTGTVEFLRLVLILADLLPVCSLTGCRARDTAEVADLQK